MTALPPPIPVGLRRPARSRRRRRLALLVLAPLALLVLPAWRVSEVRVQACDGIPPAVVAGLEGLAGTPVALIDLEWVRRCLEVWPGVRDVEVRLSMPGTLNVRAYAERPAGSVRVAGGWHAVCADGSGGPRLAGPRAPVLEGLDMSPAALRTALAVAERVAGETGLTAASVRRILPGDLEVTLVRGSGEGRPLVAHVAARASAGELRWAALLRGGEVAAVGWVDAREDDRLVLGGNG